MPKLSVIIPVFGVEKYIERCSRSLFEQTLQDIEFIFVNDCTRDSSMDILSAVLDCYPDRRNQVRIIDHFENRGLPQARKTGVSAAAGEYVAFCDSDDWIEPDCFKTVMDSAQRMNADMVAFGYKNVGDDGTFDDDYDDSLLKNHDTALKSVVALVSSPYVWNKVVKRILFDDVCFPCSFLAEDWVLTTQLVQKAKIVEYIPDTYYNYYFKKDSSRWKNTKELCLARFADEVTNVELVKDVFKRKGEYRELRQEFVRRESIAKSMLWPVLYDRDCRKIWRKTFRDANFSILFNDYIPKWHKRRHFRYLNELYWLFKGCHNESKQ